MRPLRNKQIHKSQRKGEIYNSPYALKTSLSDKRKALDGRQVLADVAVATAARFQRPG